MESMVSVRYFSELNNGKIIDSNFEENINLRINIPYKNLKEYKKILSEKSNGTIEVEE